MDVVYTWNYLNKNYEIDHFKTVRFQNLFITDIRIRLSKHLLNQKVVYSSGCHYDKKISLIKALAELIERLVFLSPFVGPIEVLDSTFYTPDSKNKMIPLSLVTPYLSKNLICNTRGHACHSEYNLAEISCEHEYYESIIKNNLSCYLLSDNFRKTDKNILFSLGQFLDKSLLNLFEKVVVQFQFFYFCMVWHPLDRGIVGSSCDASMETAIEKSFFECLSLFHAAQQDKNNEKVSTASLSRPKVNGYYISAEQIPKPSIIKRHSQLLSDLKLFVYQAVSNV